MNVTNQQLAFARVQLVAARQASSYFAKRAHWQAAVWQLDTALEAYAAELQEQAKARVQLRPGPGIFTRLAQDCRAADGQSAEMDELARLEQTQGSWLQQLQGWVANLFSLAAGKGSVLTAETTLTELERSASGRIDLVDVVEKEAVENFSEERLAAAAELFQQLLDRHRASYAEY